MNRKLFYAMTEHENFGVVFLNISKDPPSIDKYALIFSIILDQDGDCPSVVNKKVSGMISNLLGTLILTACLE